MKKITVVIRSIGERTTGLCCDIIRRSGVNPVIVSGLPRAEAVRESYQVGYDERGDFTIVTDADMIPEPDFVDTMTSCFDGSDALCGLGRFKCFIYGRMRIGGARIYRTCDLKKIIEAIKDCDRPERGVLTNLGGKYVKAQKSIGRHAYEQYYRDIYRVCFAHGYKMRHEMIIGTAMGIIMRERCHLWFENRHADKYAQIALYGFTAGQSANSIDAPPFDYDMYKIQELPPL